MTNIEPKMSLDKFSAGAWLNLARKAFKFQREMTTRYQRLRLCNAALIFVMNIVAKVFHDNISTDS
jgi:lipocalin